MKDRLNWDDLRLVLAVRRGGGLKGAAGLLGINHATAFRRLAALEDRLGVRLFERGRAGYVPTAAGEAFVELAERTETGIDDALRRWAGRDREAAGPVRVSTTEAILRLVARFLPELMVRLPDVTVELVADNGPLDLGRREADIALRLLRPGARPNADLFGRKVGGVAYAVYAADGLASGDEALPWVTFDASLRAAPTAQWVAEHIPEERIAGRSNRMLGLLEMVRAGVGLGLLPCFLAEDEGGVVRVGEGPAVLTLDLWILTAAEQRGVARVRATMSALADALRTRRRLLLGLERPAPEPLVPARGG